MRSQVERDEVTVTIATSVLLLVGVLVVGGAATWLLASVVTLPDAAVRVISLCVLALALWIGGSYLWRHRRP